MDYAARITPHNGQVREFISAAMSDDATDSPIVEGQTIITAEVVERPPAERPTRDSIDAIAEWLIGDARRIASAASVVDEYAWRLHAAGIPVLRVTLHSGTLHPQFLGAAFVWWRDTGRTVRVMIKHEIANLIPYEANPVRRVREGGETLRRRLEGVDAQFDFSVLHEVKERGATDYFALPVGGVYGPSSYMATYVSDRPGGFSVSQIADLKRISERLSVVADMHSQKHIAENILKAYLGPLTGPRVLAGQIRRGSGEAMAAVLWSSDLRGFTQLSDHLPGEQVIAILDLVFDAQARAIASHGGEILKFIGDGLLAIFPVAAPDGAAQAAAAAMSAAREALAAVQALDREVAGGDALKMVIALHYGTMIYGNIGAADRLDFTVIGPGVNLVSRIEAVAKSLDLPLIVSDDFARVYGRTLRSLGPHKLRGLDQPHELFAPSDATLIERPATGQPA
jgi:adenylate cyclase